MSGADFMSKVFPILKMWLKKALVHVCWLSSMYNLMNFCVDNSIKWYNLFTLYFPWKENALRFGEDAPRFQLPDGWNRATQIQLWGISNSLCIKYHSCWITYQLQWKHLEEACPIPHGWLCNERKCCGLLFTI